jgi:hypothetical protein
MSREESKKPKLIRAPGDLVTKLNEAANRQGKTFYNYVADIFEQAVRAYEMKRDLKEIIDSYEIFEVYKEAGTVFTPRHIIDYLIERTYNKDGESLQKLWYQTGKWYGIYFKERFNDSLEAFLRLLREGRWDLNEVTMRQNEGTVEFSCISAFISQERTNLIQNFIEGAMHSLGYKTQDKDCFRGIIRLKFSNSNVSPQ